MANETQANIQNENLRRDAMAVGTGCFWGGLIRADSTETRLNIVNKYYSFNYQFKSHRIVEYRRLDMEETFLSEKDCIEIKFWCLWIERTKCYPKHLSESPGVNPLILMPDAIEIVP